MFLQFPPQKFHFAKKFSPNSKFFPKCKFWRLMVEICDLLAAVLIDCKQTPVSSKFSTIKPQMSWRILHDRDLWRETQSSWASYVLKKKWGNSFFNIFLITFLFSFFFTAYYIFSCFFCELFTMVLVHALLFRCANALLHLVVSVHWLMAVPSICPPHKR